MRELFDAVGNLIASLLAIMAISTILAVMAGVTYRLIQAAWAFGSSW